MTEDEKKRQARPGDSHKGSRPHRHSLKSVRDLPDSTTSQEPETGQRRSHGEKRA